jgi:hypothetical protein
MVVDIDGKQIDYYSKEATRIYKLRTLKYKCITCRAAIRARSGVMMTRGNNNKYNNEVPSTTALDIVTQKAYMVLPSHVPGCPHSSAAHETPAPKFVKTLSASELELMGKLTVCLSQEVSIQFLRVYLNQLPINYVCSGS